MRKIALFIAMLLIPCMSFAGLLGSNSSTTPVSKEYKQQLMGSPVYIQIFKEERTLDLFVKMGETKSVTILAGWGRNSARVTSKVRKGFTTFSVTS